MRARPLLLLPVALALLALLALAGPVRAEDAPPDPAALLRQAQTAESVDHDVVRAMEIYRRVVATGGNGDAARDAALRLAHLLEARGDRAGALQTLEVVTERFSSRLDDEQKRRVHEAMARLLPAGSHARSPLGDVYVLPDGGPAAPPAGSPLEQKILSLLSRLDDVDPQRRAAVEDEVTRALAPVGRDALPVLERVMNGERPERARFAARIYAQMGQALAVPGLVRAVRDGDGFTRAAAVDALRSVTPGPDTSTAFVEAVEPLLDLPALKDWRDRIRDALPAHISGDDLMKRHAAGGPDAMAWLGYAISRGFPPAIARAADLARQGGPAPEGLVDVLEKLAGSGLGVSNDGVRVSVKQGVPGDLRLAMLEAVTAQRPTFKTVDAAASIAAGCRVGTSAEQAARAAAMAWSHALSSEDPEVTAEAMASLARADVRLGAEMLADPAHLKAYREGLPGAVTRIGGFDYAYVHSVLVGRAVQAAPGFWPAVAEILEKTALSQGPGAALASWIGSVLEQDLPPKDFDARWLGVLLRIPSDDHTSYPPWLVRAAARSGDPRFLEFARGRMLSSSGQNVSQFLSSLLAKSYAGPARSALAVEVLFSGRRIGPELLAAVFPDREFWTAVLDRLEKADDVAAQAALSRLQSAGWGGGHLEGEAATPPAATDARWAALLRRPGIDLGAFPLCAFRGLVRSGSSDVAALIRVEANPQAQDRDVRIAMALLHALSDYPVAQRRALCIEILSGPAYHDFYAVRQAFDHLIQDPSPEAAAAVRTLAGQPAAPGSTLAVERLAEQGDRATLVTILETAGKAEAAGSRPWRGALITASRRLHLREAIPFLLLEFRRGDFEGDAATAMDAIRAYHQRLAGFEAYAQDGGGGRRDLAALLEDKDPEIRRAAVTALGAMGDRDALPTLVRMAKEEKDPRVRQAALEAVDRIARSAPPPAPAPATPEKPQ